MKKVSIIIPCYNHAQFLEKAIQSCLDQSHQNIEVIIIDDGSTDNSIQVAKSFKDERILVIEQNNSGVGIARNRGIKQSKGEYLNFLDADDWIHLSKIEKQVAVLDQNPDMPMVLCDVEKIYASKISEDTYSVGDALGYNKQDLFCALVLGGFFPPHVPLVRKSSLLKAGLFDKNKSTGGTADYDLWLRISAHNGKAHYLDEKLAFYRILPNSMSKNEYMMNEGYKLCLKKIIQTHPERASEAMLAFRKEKDNLQEANRWLQSEIQSLKSQEETSLSATLLKNKHQNVYIWGAGAKGEEAYHYLRSLNVFPKAFIASKTVNYKNKDIWFQYENDKLSRFINCYTNITNLA